MNDETGLIGVTGEQKGIPRANTQRKTNISEEREKSWLLTNERAMEIYDSLQEFTDLSTWEVLQHSTHKRIPLLELRDDTIKKLRNVGYEPINPIHLCWDFVHVVDGLTGTMETMRTRLNDSFRSLLVVHEDMNNFIDGLETDEQGMKEKLIELEEENQHLQAQNDEMHKQLTFKEAGIKPLMDILDIRMTELLNMYKDMSKILDKPEDIKKYENIFKKEVERTYQLVEIKRQQIFETKSFLEEKGFGDEPEPPKKPITTIRQKPEPPKEESGLPDKITKANQDSFDENYLKVMPKRLRELHEKVPLRLKVAYWQTKLSGQFGKEDALFWDAVKDTLLNLKDEDIE